MNFKRKNHIVARKIHDTFFLIDIKDAYKDEKAKLYEINEVGFFLWTQINDGINMDNLVDALVKRIDGDISYDVVEADVKEFIDDLIDIGFLEE